MVKHHSVNPTTVTACPRCGATHATGAKVAIPHWLVDDLAAFHPDMKPMIQAGCIGVDESSGEPE